MICIGKTVQAKKVYLPWSRAKTLFEEIVKDELERVKQKLSNATRDGNLGIVKYLLDTFSRLQTLKKQAKLNLPFNSYFI